MISISSFGSGSKWCPHWLTVMGICLRERWADLILAVLKTNAPTPVCKCPWLCLLGDTAETHQTHFIVILEQSIILSLLHLHGEPKQDGTMGILFVRWRTHPPEFLLFTSHTLWNPWMFCRWFSMGGRCNYQSQYCLNLHQNHRWEMNKVNCTPYQQIPSSASHIRQQGRGPTGIQITAGEKREEPADNFLRFLRTKNEYKNLLPILQCSDNIILIPFKREWFEREARGQLSAMAFDSLIHHQPPPTHKHTHIHTKSGG